MTSFKALMAATATTILVPVIAMASVSLGDKLGSTDDEIRANLEASGYEVLEIEHEDGEIEAEVVLDGKTYEIELSPETGDVIGMELEDDDEDEDDD